MLKSLGFLMVGFVILLGSSGAVFADYIIVLNNGGRVTVQSYWEENGMVKFKALGGEFGVTKGHVKSILTPKPGESKGLVLDTFPESGRDDEVVVIKGDGKTPSAKNADSDR